MEILITVTDKKGEITIRRDNAGGRFIQGYEKAPVLPEIVDRAIDLIEKEAKDGR